MMKTEHTFVQGSVIIINLIAGKWNRQHVRKEKVPLRSAAVTAANGRWSSSDPLH